MPADPLRRRIPRQARRLPRHPLGHKPTHELGIERERISRRIQRMALVRVTADKVLLRDKLVDVVRCHRLVEVLRQQGGDPPRAQRLGQRLLRCCSTRVSVIAPP
ncbi:hypothetical protein ACFQ2B_40840 [Streptomyces stramineus]